MKVRFSTSLGVLWGPTVLWGLTILLILMLFAPSLAGADESSENYKKSEKFLPGEEVVTPTGQKLRVWSTEGPVPVSPPPEPFEAPEERQIEVNELEIKVGDQRRPRRNIENGDK